MNARDESISSVNSHFLNHVLASSESHDLIATHDIVATGGTRLLLKGSRIDATVRDRLLAHKLLKPLEDCVQVVDGVSAERIESIAEQLLERHALLAALCDGFRVQAVPVALARIQLSYPVRSLLTIYGEYRTGRYEHAIGVAMLAMALARRMFPTEVDRHRLLAIAGLLHDVGELYVDPAYLDRKAPLDPVQWRNIVTHPVQSYRVLRNMDGISPEVAQAVLMHHERLDGFGYPRGIQGDALPMNAQIVGAADWLMALIESGRTPLASASVATRLMPGEFDGELLQVIVSAARSSDKMKHEIAASADLEQVLPRIEFLVGVSNRCMQSRPWIDQRIKEAGGDFRRALESSSQRMRRVHTSFTSTGLNVENPAGLLSELASLQDPQVHLEVTTIVREIEWRVQEVVRECLLRSALVKPEESAVLRELVERIKGQALEPAY
jgi:HD-GYP domain-containing protein (c-di-GMP phosphodiesterase class II)